MANAGTFNFSGPNGIEFGATLDLLLELRYPNGDPVDLTFYEGVGSEELRAHFRETLDDAAIVFDLSSEAGAFPATTLEIIQPGTAGNLRFVISVTDGEAAQTASQNTGTYDLEGQKADGSVTRLSEGAWTGSDNVTRA